MFGPKHVQGMWYFLNIFHREIFMCLVSSYCRKKRRKCCAGEFSVDSIKYLLFHVGFFEYYYDEQVLSLVTL